MLTLQEEGLAAVSDTTVHGHHCLRAAINNHRTRGEDLELLVRETLRLGRAIARHGAAG
jgi:aromatic-L-amino-acid/L-tryptophan decarboxylase